MFYDQSDIIDKKMDTFCRLIYVAELYYRHIEGSRGQPRFIIPIYIEFYGYVFEKNKFIFANL